jgi:hypothetical protein
MERESIRFANVVDGQDEFKLELCLKVWSIF